VLTFAAVLQWVHAKFGVVGRLISLVLLMVQLTSAGGTYPVETSPGFFQALHPYLPMTYVVTGLRHLISGGPTDPVWRAALVLAVFLVGGLALSSLTAQRMRVWSLRRLHPELAV
jgi:putative membrane protein